MTIEPLELPGCCLVRPTPYADRRGSFTKVFEERFFRQNDLETHFVEQYYTSSHAGVLRGFHFQMPPHAHAKLVYCVAGIVTDVALDLRIGSPTYGRHVALRLSPAEAAAIYIPAGLAHGFYVHEGPAILVYNTTTPHVPDRDIGIRWNTANVGWPTASPVLSARNEALPPFEEFNSPFRYSVGKDAIVRDGS